MSQLRFLGHPLVLFVRTLDPVFRIVAATGDKPYDLEGLPPRVEAHSSDKLDHAAQLELVACHLVIVAPRRA